MINSLLCLSLFCLVFVAVERMAAVAQEINAVGAVPAVGPEDRVVKISVTANGEVTHDFYLPNHQNSEWFNKVLMDDARNFCEQYKTKLGVADLSKCIKPINDHLFSESLKNFNYKEAIRASELKEAEANAERLRQEKLVEEANQKKIEAEQEEANHKTSYEKFVLELENGVEDEAEKAWCAQNIAATPAPCQWKDLKWKDKFVFIQDFDVKRKEAIALKVKNEAARKAIEEAEAAKKRAEAEKENQKKIEEEEEEARQKKSYEKLVLELENGVEDEAEKAWCAQNIAATPAPCQWKDLKWKDKMVFVKDFDMKRKEAIALTVKNEAARKAIEDAAAATKRAEDEKAELEKIRLENEKIAKDAAEEKERLDKIAKDEKDFEEKIRKLETMYENSNSAYIKSSGLFIQAEKESDALKRERSSIENSITDRDGKERQNNAIIIEKETVIGEANVIVANAKDSNAELVKKAETLQNELNDIDLQLKEHQENRDKEEKAEIFANQIYTQLNQSVNDKHNEWIAAVDKLTTSKKTDNIIGKKEKFTEDTNEVNAAKQVLETAKNELATAKNELIAASNKLKETKNKVVELEQRREVLETDKSNLNVKRNENDAVIAENDKKIEDANLVLVEAMNQKSELVKEAETLQDKLNENSQMLSSQKVMRHKLSDELIEAGKKKDVAENELLSYAGIDIKALDSVANGNSAVADRIVNEKRLRKEEEEKKMIDAINAGVVDSVREIILNKFPKEKLAMYIDKENLTYLNVAISNHHVKNMVEIVRVLLKGGADPNMKGSNGNTALIQAISNNAVEIVTALLEKGADANIKGSNGNTPLIETISNNAKNTVKIVKDLLGKGADPNIKGSNGNTPLIETISNNAKNAVKIVEDLLEKGADPNIKGSNGDAPLIQAISNKEKNAVKIVKALLDKGADANTKGSNGDAALILAISNSDSEIVKLLLDKGADPKNDIALVMAVSKKIPEIVKHLLDKGANANSADSSGTTVLSLAISSVSADIVQALLDKGANIKESKGDPYLVQAVTSNNTNVVKAFLVKETDIIESNGAAALMKAVSMGSLEIVKLLLEKGANKDAADVLHKAVSKGSKGIVKALLEKGADVNAKGSDGEVPLVEARANIELMKLLLSKKASLCLKMGDKTVKDRILSFYDDEKDEKHKEEFEALIESHYDASADSNCAKKKKGLFDGFFSFFSSGKDSKASKNDGKNQEVKAVDQGGVWNFLLRAWSPFQYFIIPVYLGFTGQYFKLPLWVSYSYRQEISAIIGEEWLVSASNIWDVSAPYLKIVVAAITFFSVAYLAYLYFTRPDPRNLKLHLDEIRTMAGDFAGKTGNPDPLLGHVCIVTGSTSGLGLEIASVLYEIGGTVIIPARDLNRGEGIIRGIKSRFPNSKGKLFFISLDTEDLVSVNKFVQTFKQSFNQLSILVNNAGIHYMSKGFEALYDNKFNVEFRSPQGFDKAFATNYLGHFHLTNQLLDLMQKTAEMKRKEGNVHSNSRIINMSSCYSFQSSGDMLYSEKYGVNGDYCWMPEAARCDVNTYKHRNNAYCNNKLAQILHAKALTNRIQQSHPDVSIIATCPGWVSTNFLPDTPSGNFVRNNGFPVNVGICSAVHGMFNHKCIGGEFYMNSRSPLFGKTGNRLFLKALTMLDIRENTINMIAGYLLLTQTRTFGPSNDASSPESYDSDLADSLFDWSMQTSNKFMPNVLAADKFVASNSNSSSAVKGSTPSAAVNNTGVRLTPQARATPLAENPTATPIATAGAEAPSRSGRKKTPLRTPKTPSV